VQPSGVKEQPNLVTFIDRAFAVKVATKRLPVFPFSGFDLYHHFRNDAFYDLYNLLKVRKTGKRESFCCNLYCKRSTQVAAVE
jgi:hypothetical protein